MHTDKKMRLVWWVTAAVTVIAVVLATASMILEFDSEIGYYAHSAPLHVTSQILIALLTVFVAVIIFTFKKHEICPVIYHNAAPFRFFASMTACLSLLNTYVEFTTLRSLFGTQTSPMSSANVITILALVLSVASFFVYFAYCFGKNDKKSDGRGLCGMVAVGYLLVHLMETHLVWPAQMNNPVKTALQTALIALIFALTYTFKCEFAINKASGRLRTFFMLICPIFVLTFSIPTVIAYYARIYTSFNTLVDAIYMTCACGFVLASYMPQDKARPIAAAEWAEITASIEVENDKSADAEEACVAESEKEGQQNNEE